MREQLNNEIIGRKKELKKLKELYNSNSAEFLVVYGRRRVGKTYLIKQFFNTKSCVLFEQTGLKDGALAQQLEIFSIALAKTFYPSIKIIPPQSWLEALRQLTTEIDKIPKNKHVVIFFDELPWLAHRKSNFMQALDYVWNTSWTYRKKLILVGCGSAASWMLEKLIYAKGGLHNRITATISLQPFSLNETQEYLSYRGIKLTQQQVTQIYMVLGGIPHYLHAIRKGLSAAQNINTLCFAKDGLLFNEFEKLFTSLFESSEIYMGIIRAIAKNRNGISREELLKRVKSISDGGRLKSRLKSLEEAGFIAAFTPLGRVRKGTYYRIIDEYIHFYLYWVEPARHQSSLSRIDKHFWESKAQQPKGQNWAGYAFEAICFKHIQAIKQSLNLDKIISACGSWGHRGPKKTAGRGAQIDLLFDREDNCITICEIKYSDKPFVITKGYANELENKRSVYAEQTQTKKQVFFALIAANGVRENEYSNRIVTQVVTLEDLFKEEAI